MTIVPLASIRSAAEDLDKAHDGEDIRVKHCFRFREVDVKRRDRVVYARVVDEVVETAAGGDGLDVGEALLNRIFVVDIEWDGLDAEVCESGERRGGAGGGEDAETSCVEADGE